MPVLALVPVWLLAMLVFWWPIQLLWFVPFWLFAAAYLAGVVVLFARPVQRVVFIRLLGARRPHPSEVGALLPAWRTVARANGVPPNRFMLAVLDADELNGSRVAATSSSCRPTRSSTSTRSSWRACWPTNSAITSDCTPSR